MDSAFPRLNVFWNSARFGILHEPKYKCSVPSFIISYCVRSKGIRPRHPPREFPLGLRAPVLGAVFAKRLKYQEMSRAKTRSWLGRGFSSPQCVASVRARFTRIPQSGTGLTPPGRTNPSQVFHVRVCCVAFAADFSLQLTQALVFSPDTLIYSHTTIIF